MEWNKLASMLNYNSVNVVMKDMLRWQSELNKLYKGANKIRYPIIKSLSGRYSPEDIRNTLEGLVSLYGIHKVILAEDSSYCFDLLYQIKQISCNISVRLGDPISIILVDSFGNRQEFRGILLDLKLRPRKQSLPADIIS